MYFLHHNFHYNCDLIYGYWAQPLLGLTIYLYCGFGFRTMGGPVLGNSNTLLFLQAFLSSSHNCSFALFECLLTSLSVLPRIANPVFSLNPSIYNFG